VTCRLVACLVAVLALVPSAAGGGRARPGSFVVRSGSRLELAGKPFRFGGANVEWLGLLGYGPADPAGPRPPSHFEIDDALATARLLGATVVRSQTLVDSVGCAACIEPSLGVFDERAFEASDYALASARAHGLRIIATIVGDDAADGGTGCVYLRWRGLEPPDCSLLSMDPFWSDPLVIGDVEAHIAAVLNHVNTYTHVAYKDDPTILGWDLLNGGGSPPGWTKQIADFVRGLDPRHLILSGYANAGLASVDACVSFVYPHWGLPYAEVRQWIAQCAKHRKPYLVYEYGWDRTNFPTLPRLRAFLSALQRNPGVAGDAFWALEAHADGHGWLPIPADVTDPAQAARVETGEWWALYYPGLRTLVTTVADMRARAEAIRAHDYAMRGVRVPPQPPPSPPTVTSAEGGHVYWEGSPGARDYTVQRAPRAGGPWQTICRECATDASDGYVDAGGNPGAWYRVVAYDLDGRASPPSAAVQAPAG
jgi:mannan endo-1,4-beta-mannosidase